MEHLYNKNGHFKGLQEPGRKWKADPMRTWEVWTGPTSSPPYTPKGSAQHEPTAATGRYPSVARSSDSSRGVDFYVNALDFF